MTMTTDNQKTAKMTLNKFSRFAERGKKDVTPLSFLLANRDWIVSQNNPDCNKLLTRFDKCEITPSQTIQLCALHLNNVKIQSDMNKRLDKMAQEKEKPETNITVEVWLTPYDKQGKPLTDIMATDEKGIPVSEVFSERRSAENWANNRLHDLPVNHYAIIEDRRFEPPSRVKVTSSQADEAKTKKFGGLQSTHTNRSNAPKIDPFKGQKNVMRVR